MRALTIHKVSSLKRKILRVDWVCVCTFFLIVVVVVYFIIYPVKVNLSVVYQHKSLRAQ